MKRADNQGGTDTKIFTSQFFIETAERHAPPRHRLRAPARARPTTAADSPAMHPPACTIALLCDPRPRASPPAAATGPAEGSFARANPSAAVPVAHPPPSGALGHAFVRFPCRFARARIRAASRTGLGFGYIGAFTNTFIRVK